MNYLFYIAVIFTIISRAIFIKVPFFISDEAQLMTFGAQLLNGAYYARDVVDTRGPGGYYLAAVITWLFGFGNTVAFHVVGIILQLIILLLLRRLAGQLFNRETANTACLFYAVFSYSYISHDMLALNVEVLALPFLLAGALFFGVGLKRLEHGAPGYMWRFLICGLFCAITFSIKQVIAACLLAYILLMVISWKKEVLPRKGLMPMALMGFGFVAGFMLIFGRSLMGVGVRETFYWLALFSMKHYNPGVLGRTVLFTQRAILLYIAQPLLWTLGLLWLVKFIHTYSRGEYQKYQGALLILILLASQLGGAWLAGQSAGHYFIPSIAVLSIISAEYAASFLGRVREQELSGLYYRPLIGFIILVGLLPPILNYTFFPEGVQTAEYSIASFYKEKLSPGDDPITRSVAYIRENTSGPDKIFVLGNLYEIYPLAKRLPATVAEQLNWFGDRAEDVYLRATYNMIIRSLENDPPAAIVFPCPAYRGIDLKDGPWEEIRDLLQRRYQSPRRFAWKSRLRFFGGKQKLMENVDEWIEVYRLKPGEKSTQSGISGGLDRAP
jgi:hypothetical protein